jgi:endonuclease/exonuclease/phosphatase family metal-dependent hydrolase
MKAFQKKKRIFYSKQVKTIDPVGKLKLGLLGKLVYILNVIFAIALLLACLAPFITWELFSFLSFLSLIVPYLVMTNILFFGYWSFRRKNYFLISLFVLLLGYLIQGTFVRIFNSNDEIRGGELSLLTFNSHSSQGITWSRNPGFGDEIVDFIAKQDCDIICFQEFKHRNAKDFEQYSYKYVNNIFKKERRVVQAIFSKYPIIAKGALDFPGTSNNAIYADVLINEDTVRVYNLHLQSLKIRPSSIKREDPQRLLGRLDRSFQKQLEQALLVRKHIDAVPYKSIISGDFNNTQFSSVYNIIKDDMKDSFHEMGFGLGGTYDFKFLPFRIDFILADPGIEVKSHTNFNVKLSDHTPVMASFCLQD